MGSTMVVNVSTLGKAMCVSLARRVNSTAVNRRTFLAFTAVAFATAGLSACSRPAPEPNQTLVSLAEQARTDAAALAPVRSDLAAIRERHATMLSTEVARDCGHFENGSVPDSCVSTTSPSAATTTSVAAAAHTEPNAILKAALDQVNSLLADIPADSAVVVARIHTELAILTMAAPPAFDQNNNITPTAADSDQVKKALEWEYATIYGLEVHEAFVANELASTLNDALDEHRSIATALRMGLESANVSDIPVAEAGYTINDVKNSGFFADSASQSVLAWHDYASHASDASWRALCIRIASTIAVTAVPALEFAGIEPWRADFLQLN